MIIPLLDVIPIKSYQRISPEEYIKRNDERNAHNTFSFKKFSPDFVALGKEEGLRLVNDEIVRAGQSSEFGRQGRREEGRKGF